MANIGQGRPLRVCDLCGGVDDHPRHVIAGTIAGEQVVEPPAEQTVAAVSAAAPAEHLARLLRDLFDTTASDRHLDCCAAAGCPLPADDPANCAQRTAGVRGTGRKMLDHLTREG